MTSWVLRRTGSIDIVTGYSLSAYFSTKEASTSERLQLLAAWNAIHAAELPH